MATMIEATEFENEILRHRSAQGEHLDFQCVHRIAIRTDGDKVRVFHTTNDNDDDGFPDGVWPSLISLSRTSRWPRRTLVSVA